MDIQFKTNGNGTGSFFIEKEGRQVAELDFEVKNNLLNAYHTGVRPELEGQGIAGKLFDELVKYARKNGYKVIPSCSYILAKFRRNPEGFKDIWHRTDDEHTGDACGVKPKHTKDIDMNTTNARKLTSIRLNSNLYEHLNRLAKKENRSFNNYVETLLSYASDFSEPDEETRIAIEDSRKERKSAPRFTDIDSLITSLEK